MTGSVRHWRQLTVWLHVVTSVGWMSLALTLLALLALSATGDDPSASMAATSMAHYLDTVLLAPLANASASTGLMLSVGTAWGLTHHRWVLTKFVITLVQLYVGIFVLSEALGETARAASSGGPGAAPGLIVGTAAMAGAVGFQAWLSVAKPGGKTRRAYERSSRRPIKLPTARGWVFATAAAAPIVDIAVGTIVGFPTPVLSIVMLVVAIVARRRLLRGAHVR